MLNGLVTSALVICVGLQHLAWAGSYDADCSQVHCNGKNFCISFDGLAPKFGHVMNSKPILGGALLERIRPRLESPARAMFDPPNRSNMHPTLQSQQILLLL